MRNPFKSKEFKSEGKRARTYAVYSEAGHAHRNEDVAVVQRHLDDNSVLLCVLADGQGGQAGGAVASRTAVDTCLELALGKSVKRLLNPSIWYEILCGVDDAVNEHPNAGFTP